MKYTAKADPMTIGVKMMISEQVLMLAQPQIHRRYYY